MMDTRSSAEAIALLDRLIATPSISRAENATADLLESYLDKAGAECRRVGNNVWALAAPYDPARPTLMLNSHHDTVKPMATYTLDPFMPLHRDGRIYGLGSNDAGASAVSLTRAFLDVRRMDLPVNLLLALTAEEEVSGTEGMELLMATLGREGIDVDMAIVGEPTGMQAAVAERGLLVLDCTARGVSGHAARCEGVNAIDIALRDIERLRSLRFDRESEILGPVKITVTQIEAGTQHNVVPDRCHFVADVRTTDAYSNAETAAIISESLESEVKPRSTRLNASAIAASHPLVEGARALGAATFVSPTLSDRALLGGIPALKIGPGNSARSHTADEYIFADEISEAITFYKKLILSL